MPSKVEPFSNLVAAFRKWDSQVGCARFKDKPNGVPLNQSKVVSLQEVGDCGGLKLNHVSVLVKGWTWIPDNLDNLYSCSCGLSCLWTKSLVLADKPDALLFESSMPPVQAYVQQLETSRVKLMQLELEIEKARKQGMYIRGARCQLYGIIRNN
ncbi:alpha-(1,4)-fucosyltransferase-like [Glycine soja]|uniref:alpha-(1,4)-fucosyltransferase-like n=1 Tax=Glycine soja TaxID=3848 RepID=UPI0010394004|nr:alpha-(1,4)-fucosyltransferase-like [Glycine soja]